MVLNLASTRFAQSSCLKTVLQVASVRGVSARCIHQQNAILLNAILHPLGYPGNLNMRLRDLFEMTLMLTFFITFCITFFISHSV